MSPGQLTEKLQDAGHAAPARAAARAAGETPLILVVDDDEGVRELAGSILREAGYRTLEAETGQRAMMLFEENSDIRLVFTDIVMPGLDGFKLADMVKFRRPDMKILYATAFMDEAREKLGVVHGDILRKPYRPAQLEALVKAALA